MSRMVGASNLRRLLFTIASITSILAGQGWGAQLATLTCG